MPPMKLWKFSVLMIPVLALLSCSSPQVLEVRPLHLREIGGDDGDDPMIRGERMRRMHGAISVAEQPSGWLNVTGSEPRQSIV